MSSQYNGKAHLDVVHDLDDAALSLPKVVLIVEDDADLIDSLRTFLEGNGYQVETASDGVQGIKKVMARDYSVILCDMVMPNLAGDMFYTAVERVKPHLCKRFVFMTGYRDDKKVDEFIRKVRGLALWKPFKLHLVIEAFQAVELRAKQSP